MMQIEMIYFCSINKQFMLQVKPKHMACISVGSLYLANQQLSLPAMDPEDLVLISQCRCTAGDLTRMATIVADKLGAQPGCPPITALTFLRPLHAMFKQRALELGVLEPFQKVVTVSNYNYILFCIMVFYIYLINVYFLGGRFDNAPRNSSL